MHDLTCDPNEKTDFTKGSLNTYDETHGGQPYRTPLPESEQHFCRNFVNDDREETMKLMENLL